MLKYRHLHLHCEKENDVAQKVIKCKDRTGRRAGLGMERRGEGGGGELQPPTLEKKGKFSLPLFIRKIPDKLRSGYHVDFRRISSNFRALQFVLLLFI